jgi:hypothetical protein
MRVLLDESLPRKLAASLLGHDVTTVPQAGWSGMKNGQLLRLASERFDVFVTPDQNLRYQQNLAALSVAVVVVKASGNDLASLLPLVPALLEAISVVRRGELREIGPSS